MIFSSVAGFLRFTLAFSIFSSSFIIFCFLFSLFVPCSLFTVCLFNPFSLSISFHFFPLSLFCFSTLLYPLGSLSLSPLLSSFSIIGCRVAGSPGCRVAGLPGTTAPLPSSLPLRLGLCALEATRIYCQSPRRKWESALHHSKSHPAVRRESVREERVREERRSKSSRKRGSDPNSEMHGDAASFNPSHIASAFPRVWYLARILIAMSESSEGRARHSPLWCPFWKVSYKAPGTSVPVGMTMVFSYQDYPWIESIDNGFLRQGWW